MFLSFAKVTDAGEVQYNTNNVEGDAPVSTTKGEQNGKKSSRKD